MGEATKQKIVSTRFYKFFSKYWIWIFCITVIFLQIFQVLYFKRESFFTTYDISYWKERFEHSQWQLPLTQRIIGDDGLYAYNGYALFHGVSPYTVAAQVPPLGKYILGLSIDLLGNASYSSLVFSIGSLIFFYLIAKKLFFSSKKAIISTAFCFLEPFFFTQLWSWMLDIFQLFFLLANIYFFVVFFESKQRVKSVVLLSGSGIFLAFFSQTKLPILLPLLVIIESGYLIYLRKFKEILIFLFSFICAFIITNIQFFIDGENFVDFIKFQKYVFVFYSQSRVAASFFAVWQTLFYGKVPQITSGALTNVREWWPVLGVIGFTGLGYSVFSIFSKKANHIWKTIAFFLCGSLIIFSVVPFYPRYLILLIPFFYLTFFKIVYSVIPEKKFFIFTPFLFIGLFYSFYYLLPRSDSTLSTFYHSFENRYFQDVYVENLSQNSKRKIARNEFFVTIQRALNDAEVGAISIKEKSKNVSLFSNTGTVLIHVIYKTRRLGKFEEDKIIMLKKEKDEWKIEWDWNLVLNKFEIGDSVKAFYVPGRRGTIFSYTGEKIAEDKPGTVISIDPGKINVKDEEKMLEFLSKVTGQEKVRLQAAYLDNPMKGEYVLVATLFTDLSDEEKEKLFKFDGIKLEKYPNRITYGPLGGKIGNNFYYECCTRIYSSYNYSGISGLEKEYENLLRGEDGGKMVLIDKFGAQKRILLEKNEKRGKDAVFPN